MRRQFLLISLILAFSLIQYRITAGGSSDPRDPFVDGPTARVSVDSAGGEGNGPSARPALSADGRFIAFESDAGNLVAGDTNQQRDIFIHDLQAGITERVSAGPGQGEPNGSSQTPAISADGRFVAFVSYANNLVAGDSNKSHDIFVYDRQTGVTERISVGPDGQEADGYSVAPAISADGRIVAFASGASNLVEGDHNNNQDIFVRDRLAGTTARVSVGPDGQEANGPGYDPALSADGRVVAFASSAGNLVPGDGNGVHDIFVYDAGAGVMERVSVNSLGVEGNDASQVPALSADGRVVSYYSKATNLVPDDTNNAFDVFLRDRLQGTTERVSVGAGGREGNGPSFFHALSADGRAVAFFSFAGNLVSDDANKLPDVFLRDRRTGSTARVSVGQTGQEANGSPLLRHPVISADGHLIAFDSDATNLVSGDSNAADDVFVHREDGGTGASLFVPMVIGP